MNSTRKYRNNGTIGALLDEYEKAINELRDVIQSISQEDLLRICDYTTKDEDCRSIQTILTHVIQSGYTYVIEVRRWKGEEIDYRDKINHSTPDEYKIELQKMFEYNVALFEDYSTIQLDEKDPNLKIFARWGQRYDVNQMYAHAIVHVLKHRRQIERFIEKMDERIR